ncbi:geranylgeranyl reductase family protein [Silvibacterium dinghuense]|nr:geranylgeranyl reductase family protein [Silvibacterium dinghuense]
MKIWDAMIVGAGPAGCAAAYDLALAGHAVLLLDRAEFPRPKACAGGLTTKTVEALRYSVDPVIRQRLHALTIERDGDHRTVLRRRADYCFMTVRKELDAFCFEQTVAAGAQFRRIRAIESIEEAADTVRVRVDGEELCARFLIGADGVHSQVRRMTDPDAGRWFWRAFALEACISVSGREADELIFDFAPVRDGYGWFFPKGDHVNVGLYSYDRNEKIDRARLSAYVHDRCGSAMLEEVMGQYAGFGAGGHQPASERIFLVGDAGGFVDPLTGEGIYFAIVSGQAAAGAVAAALSTEVSADVNAHAEFRERTRKLRADLALSTSGARWFYSDVNRGYKLLSSPLLKRASIRAFSQGMNLAGLAAGVRKLAAMMAD